MTISESPPTHSWWTEFDRILHEAFTNEKSRLYGIVNNFIVVLIFFSIATIIADSVDEIHEKYGTILMISEYIVVGIFILEYAANLYVTKPRRDYVLGIWGIIDMLAIIPSLTISMDFRSLKVGRVLRVLRFMRLMRILKLTKTATHNYQESKKRKFGTLKLDIQIYFITMFAVLVISSTLIYYAEHDAQPEVFTNIPAAMWWGIVTMTTVGYGDMSPITFWGRFIAAMTSLCGLALFAMLMNVMGKAMIHGLFGTHDEEEEEGNNGAVILQISIPEQIEQLASLRDRQIIAQDEFEQKKRELLARI